MKHEDAEQGQKSSKPPGKRPDPGAFLKNLKAPMPLHRKLYLLFRNNATKLWRRQPCCGHPGEPGC